MSGIPEFASLEQMFAWAHELMASRAPDFVIGDDYLRRWYVIPRNPSANVYLHHIMHSDDDRALHDHPWANTSVLIGGRYVAHMAAPGGGEIRVTRHAGDVVSRQASDAHRLEIMPGETERAVPAKTYSSQRTSVSTFDGIGSSCQSPLTFLSQTPSLGITKRKSAGTSSARIFCASP